MHVNPIEFILTVALIIVFVYLRKKKQGQGGRKPGGFGAFGSPPPAPPPPRPAKPAKPPEEVFMDLRKRAFALDPSSIGLNVQADEPYGGLMEMGLPTTIVTLACFANGDASLLYQSGGGMTGGGVHEPVRKASQVFVSLLEKALPLMSPSTDQPLPEPETVRFYALTPRGLLTVQTDREALSDPESALTKLFYGGQEVVTVMRQIQQQRSA